MTAPDVAPDTGDSVEIRDFTLKRKRIQFRIDDDVFTAYGVLGLPLMQNLVRIGKSIGDVSDEGKIEAVLEVFDQILLPDSAKRFRERATTPGEDALDVGGQMVPILHHLLEAYGVRPTQLSSDSSTG